MESNDMPGLHLFLLQEYFLGNKKTENYTQLVQEVLFPFNGLDYYLHVEVHYLLSQLDRFPDNKDQDSSQTYKQWEPDNQEDDRHT